MFNRLTHGIDNFDLEGCRVLDLFAGTGALGLEALSRGAAFTLFIDDAVEPRGLIRRNIEHLEYTGQTKLFRRNALNLGPLKLSPFDLIFLDPPYDKQLGEKALTSAIEGQWLNPNALIILEESKKATITWPGSISNIDTRSFGTTTMHFARFKPNEEL